MIDSMLEVMDDVRLKRRTQKMRRKEEDQLRHSFPELVNHEEELDEIAREYEALHAAYTTSISDRLNAVSLRQAALLAFLIRTRPVARVLDTGSGFSSLVLAREAKRKENLTHLAVEDNEFWRGRTKEFLRESGLPSENVISWQAFQSDSSLCDFDLVFHDMGNMTTRILSLSQIEARLSSGGWLILDDMHKPTYCPHALRMLGERWIAQSLVDLTLDEVGRFAYICRQRPRQ